MAYWTEYIEALYDKRQDVNIQDNDESPQILADQVKDSTLHWKNGKVPGSINITSEKMKSLGGFRIEIIKKCSNGIYNKN